MTGRKLYTREPYLLYCISDCDDSAPAASALFSAPAGHRIREVFMKILNTPLTIKNLTLKNRILLPPMAVVKGDMESRVTDELVA